MHVQHKESVVYYRASMKFWFQIAVVTCVLTPVASAQTTIFGTNIIANPGAESGPGGDGTSQVANVPGWSRTGGCDVFGYATAANKIHGIAPNDIVPVGAG